MEISVTRNSPNPFLIHPDYVREWVEVQLRPAEFLLIDDDENDRKLFEKLSTGWNCHWDMASDCAQGLEKVVQKDYKLVFLDLKMPGVSGPDAFKLLKEARTDLRVVIVSGTIDTFSIQEITKIGFAIFVMKPAAFTKDFFSSLFRTIGVSPLPDKPLECCKI